MKVFYLSPQGNDNATGTTPEQAFATLPKTQETIRQTKNTHPITVYLQAGTYHLDQTWVLDAQDSGSPDAPIIYTTNHKACITSHAQTNALIKLTDVQYVTFKNITFENAPLNAIEIQNGTHIHFENCILRHIDHTGFRIQGGTHHSITQCTCHHIGQEAITIEAGNRQTLTAAHHEISHCHIHQTAQAPNTQSASVTLSGVGIRLSNNHIHHTPNNALNIAGNEHLITHNHIHHTNLKTDTKGALEMGGNWSERGTRIQYNHIHDLGHPNSTTKAIHLNNCASSVTILGNLFVRCTLAILIGGGRNNRIDNNIFAHCPLAIKIDGRGLDKEPNWHTHLYTTMKASFEAINPLEPPYSQYYPELQEVAMYYQAETGIPPEGNLILRNITYQSTWHHIHHHATPSMIALQNNLTYEDPLFNDAEHDDYTLQEHSPAHEIGIKSLPLDQMGPTLPTA